MIKTKDELDALPHGAIIRCEIEEYEGQYELTNVAQCCGGWHTFIVADGDLDIVDDYTPELPAQLISELSQVCRDYDDEGAY